MFFNRWGDLQRWEVRPLAEPQHRAARRQWHGVHKALADPLRIRLVEALWETPRSARELATCLGLPADRLYYHLGQLEDAGLVEVSGYRRLARGKVERVYAPAAVEPPGDAASPEEMVAFLGSVLEATRADIAAAYQAKQDGRRREVEVHRGAVRLTEQGLAELRGHIAQLAAKFGDPGDGSADGAGGAEAGGAAEGRAEDGGVWARVVFAAVDLQDRPPAVAAGSESVP
jgi:DNA-binding transcriptional ArsR family regulator